MRLTGLTSGAVTRIAQESNISWDQKERVMTSLSTRLENHLQSGEGRPGLAVRENLYYVGSDLVFRGSEVLDESFESDEMVELLWQVKEDVAEWTGLETFIEDEWTVRFSEGL